MSALPADIRRLSLYPRKRIVGGLLQARPLLFLFVLLAVLAIVMFWH